MEEFRLKTLTPVWTGGVEGKNDKLHVTGIKGSIRWWYEVLIRGLGNYACDPTANGHCELKPKELNRYQPLAQQIKEKICPACYMFGCTGWSGKFILKLMEPGTNKPVQSLSSRGVVFNLHFLEQKRIDPEEQILLKMTLKLIVDYGAIGGKTIFKPSEVKYKNTKLHHKDFGILARGEQSNLPTEKIQTDGIVQYLKKFKKKKEENKIEWPNMKYFWFVKGECIDRPQHNQLVKRNADGNYRDSVNEDDVFLGGFISSKKIFSFHGIDPENNKHVIQEIKRCFGYVKEKELETVVNLIEETDSSLKGKIEKGEEVLNEL